MSRYHGPYKLVCQTSFVNYVVQLLEAPRDRCTRFHEYNPPTSHAPTCYHFCSALLQLSAFLPQPAPPCPPASLAGMASSPREEQCYDDADDGDRLMSMAWAEHALLLAPASMGDGAVKKGYSKSNCSFPTSVSALLKHPVAIYCIWRNQPPSEFLALLHRTLITITGHNIGILMSFQHCYKWV